MNVIVDIDSLKGSIYSIESGNAIKLGILNVYNDAIVEVKPLADGGEGTLEALVEGMNGEFQQIKASTLQATTISFIDAFNMPEFILAPISEILMSAATALTTAWATNVSISERLKLIPYESVIGLTMIIISTIIWGIIM